MPATVAGTFGKIAQPMRQTTRARILESARQMFNRHGVQGTAMFRIAHDLDMSPGNLTYHFKSKSDLVLELSKAFRAQIEGAIFGLNPPLDPIEVIAHLETVCRALWAYRFLFNSAIHVSQMDIALAQQLRDSQTVIRDVLAQYFEATIARGEMRTPSRPDGVVLLSENILALWLQWLRARNIDAPDQVDADPASMRTCMRHHYSLLDPYVSREFSRKSWDEIDRRYAAPDH